MDEPTPFRSLYDLVQKAIGGEGLSLDQAFLTSTGLTVPPQIAEVIRNSFGDAKVRFETGGTLGPFDDDRFAITGITLGERFVFLPKLSVTVNFRLIDGAGVGFQVVVAQQEDWSLRKFLGEQFDVFPLDQVLFHDASFVFSTFADKAVALAFSGETDIVPGLTYDARVSLAPGNAFTQYGALFPGLGPLIEKYTAPGGEGLALSGQLNLAKVLGPGALPFPQLSLSGDLGALAAKLLDLDLDAPAVFFEILPLQALLPEAGGARMQAPLAEGGFDPTSLAAAFFPAVGVRFDYRLTLGDGTARDIRLYASLKPRPGDFLPPGQALLPAPTGALPAPAPTGAFPAPAPTGAFPAPARAGAPLPDFDWQVDLVASAEGQTSEVIQPGEAKSLAQGEGYFGAMPAPLQGFVAKVGYGGLSFSGAYSQAAEPALSLDSFAMDLRSIDGPAWSVIDDPNTGFRIDVEHFALLWTVTGMADAATRDTTLNFETALTIWPDVFVPKEPDSPNFLLRINQDLDLEARFDGTASLRAAILKLSGEGVSLPDGNGSDLKISDIAVEVKPTERSYAFRFGAEATLDLVSGGSPTPILKLHDIRVDLAAVLPDTGATATAYTARIEGAIDLSDAVGATGYLNYATVEGGALWSFGAALTHPVNLSELVDTFLAKVGLPEFMPGTLQVESFSIDGEVPRTAPSGTEEGGALTYRLGGVLSWDYDIAGTNFGIRTAATLDLGYDGAKAEGQQYSGSVVGETLIRGIIDVPVVVGYEFGQDAAQETPGTRVAILADTGAGANDRLYVDWNGLNATYRIEEKILDFTLKGWTLGRLVEAMVETLGQRDFSLPPPWDLLNRIPLDGLGLTFFMAEGADPTITARYALASPLDLGFMKFSGFTFSRRPNGRTDALGNPLSDVAMGLLDGTSPIPGLEEKFADLFDPEKGQPVDELPSGGVPGWGDAAFRLRLLALGQRIGLRNSEGFTSISDAIAKLSAALPASDGATNPIDPTNPEDGQPFYDRGKTWLVAGDFGLLKAGEDYTVDLKFLFLDPELYGLRIGFNGEKAKIFDGLALDVLYRKISADVGVFETRFTFPEAFRSLTLGAFSVTLADIEFRIYTNGDFYFDLGFPHDLDFERSFTMTAMVGPVPVLGAAGLYFGKYSAETASEANLPSSEKGQFNPVIAFGVGIRIGLGYKISAGPLNAGFSLTVFGVLEGVLAGFTPTESGAVALLAARRSMVSANEDFYYRIRGVFGIQGQLYGVVDLSIISAEVNVGVKLYAEVVFETYRAISVAAEASVHISLKIRIGFGIFSFKITVGFDATIRQEIVIGQNEPAPWDMSVFRLRRALRARLPQDRFLALYAGHETLSQTAARLARLRPRAEGRQELNLFVALSDTVFSPDPTAGDAARSQQAAFIMSYMIDAPGSSPEFAPEDSSLYRLGGKLLEHVVANITGADSFRAMAENDTVLTRRKLDAALRLLADPARSFLDYQWIMDDFLSKEFTLVVHRLNAEADCAADGSTWKARLENGAAAFPVFDGVSMQVPSAKGDGTTSTIEFFRYVSVHDSYRDSVRNLFGKVAARLDNLADETGSDTPRAGVRGLTDAQGNSAMAGLVLTDYFSILARQLVQGALDTLDSYPLVLGEKTSVNDIIRALNPSRPDVPEADHPITPAEVFLALLDTPLSNAELLYVPGVLYDVQTGDSLRAITAKYTDDTHFGLTAKALVETNLHATDILRAGTRLRLRVSASGAVFEHVIGLNDSFDRILAAGGQAGLTLDDLVAGLNESTLTDLFRPAATLALPVVSYRLAGGQTLREILNTYNVTVETFAREPRNHATPGLFDAAAVPGATVRIPGLHWLQADTLNAGLLRNGAYGKAARVCTRQLVPGLRLPNSAAGISFDQTFLYGGSAPEAKDFGLQQLTGQQFPVAPYPDDGLPAQFILRLQRDRAREWIRFDDSASAPGSENPVDLQFDFAPEVAVLARVANAIRGTGGGEPCRFAPPGLTLPDTRSFVARSAASYGLVEPVLWSLSDHTEVAGLTGAGSAGGQGVQPQPYLWALPRPVSGVAARRAATARDTGADIRRTLTLLPAFDVRKGEGDAATGGLSAAPLPNWAPMLTVSLRVQRLAGREVSARARVLRPADAPPGAVPASASQPFMYEVVGVSESDAARIAELIRFDAALTGAGAETPIRAIFVAYPDGGTDATTIIGRGSREYVSLIAETSRLEALARGADPAAALEEEGERLSGIQPGAGAFLKQLWELSINRSGGYYLLYGTLADGQGLPDHLFSNDGLATVRILIGLPRSISLPQGEGTEEFAHKFPAFADSVLTYDNVDPSLGPPVLVAEEQSAEVATGGKPWSELAADLGVAPGDLGFMNRDRPLPAGTEVPLGRFTLQVTPHDMYLVAQAPGEGTEFDKYVAILGQRLIPNDPGRLTPEILRSWNPNVSFGLWSIWDFRFDASAVFVVPEPPPEGGGPDYTLAGIAATRGERAEALGTLMAGRRIDWSTGTYSATDYAFQPGIGVGNIGLSLARTIDFGTGIEADEEDPTTYLNRRFTQMSARLRATADYEASPETMPTGSSAEGGQDSTRHAFTQSLNATLALLQGANPARWPGWLDRDTPNPYAGVGTRAQVTARWLDLYGNLVVSDWSAPVQPSAESPVDTLLIPVGYVDPVIGTDQWPNVEASYWFERRSPEGPFELMVALRLNTEAYFPASAPDAPQNQSIRAGLPAWQTQAQDDYDAFLAVIFQLFQVYKLDGGSEQSAIRLELNATVQDAGRQEIPIDELRRFVSDCGQFLDARRAGRDSALRPAITLSTRYAEKEIRAASVFELSVEMRLSRRAELCDPLLAADPARHSAASEVLPDRSPPTPEAAAAGPAAGEDLKAFAASFEAAFAAVNDGAFKLALAPTSGGGTARRPLWVVKIGDPGREPESGLTWDLVDTETYAGGPVFFAPRPVARNLRSGTVPGPDGARANVTAADMNEWLNTVYDTVDALLSPEIIVPAEIADQLAAARGEGAAPQAERLLSLKVDLARTTAETLIPVVEPHSGISDPASYAEAARRELFSRMLGRLSAASALSSVAVYDVADAADRGGGGGSAPPEVRGSAGITGGAPDAAALSVAGGGFGLTRMDTPSGPGPRSRLALTVSSGNPAARGAVPLQLAFNVTGVDTDFREVPDLPGYTQSTFLTFLLPPAATRLTAGPVTFPNVLRTLPSPPRMVDQGGRGKWAPGDPPEALADWDYLFSFDAEPPMQDSPHCRVLFNDPDLVSRALAVPGEDALFAALGAFALGSRALVAEITAAARAVGPLARSTDSDVTRLHAALDRFNTLLEDVATAYADWAKPAAGLGLRDAPERQITAEFDIELRAEGNAGVVAVTNLSVTGATGPKPEAFTPEVLLNPGRWTAEPWSGESIAGAAAAWRYRRADGSFATPEQVRRVREKQLAFRDLGLFRVQDARPTVRITRNRVLAEGLSAAPAFVFTTPETGFPAPYTPNLVYDSYDLDAALDPETEEGGSRFEAGLSRFFIGLTRRAGEDPVFLRLAGAYSYRVTNATIGLPRVSLPLNLLLPTAVTIRQASEPEIVRTVAAAMSARAAEMKLNPDSLGEPRFSLDLEIFAASSASVDKQPPLLRIRSLHAPPG
ncbi:hypothetical protein [Oceanicella sp. SM1341]|uniref:hypothetical protein n=1 Tax=Oceanicella sp. SM1341 TaxID=1548889 RepID=UPI000E542C14|nr:hypothetical protein [Oceanicella sp. SM1341]